MEFPPYTMNWRNSHHSFSYKCLRRDSSRKIAVCVGDSWKNESDEGVKDEQDQNGSAFVCLRLVVTSSKILFLSPFCLSFLHTVDTKSSPFFSLTHVIVLYFILLERVDFFSIHSLFCEHMKKIRECKQRGRDSLILSSLPIPLKVHNQEERPLAVSLSQVLLVGAQ